MGTKLVRNVARAVVSKSAKLRFDMLLNCEDNADGTEATAGRCLGELPRGVAIEREHAFS